MKTLTVAAILALTLAAGDAKGTLTFTSKGKDLSLTIAHAYFVTGPDAMDAKVTIRRLIFTNADIEAKIKACADMHCTDTLMTEGLQVDVIPGPRFNYWMTLNNQLVQFSGTERPEALTTTVDKPAQMAGKLTFDGTRMGGPKVDVTFDATLVKAFTKAR